MTFGYNKKLLLQSSRELNLLLTPSLSSGIVVVFLSLGITFGTLFKVLYHGSSLEHLVYLDQNKQAIADNYQTVQSSSLLDSWIGYIPLLLFWGGMGLVVYWFCEMLYNVYRSAAMVQEELHYVHSNRQAIIKSLVSHMVVRLVTLAVWILYAWLTIHFLLPYVIAIAYVAGGVHNLLSSILYMARGTLLLLVAFHIHVILCRLFFLKPRLFGINPVELQNSNNI
jgi:hypothetical protein